VVDGAGSTNHVKKGKILVQLKMFRFEYSGRFIVPPPSNVLLSYGYE